MTLKKSISEPSAAEARIQCDRILVSKGFIRSSRQSAFLDFVVNAALAGEEDRLKEFTIGIEVFEKDASFDPAVDSIVRVEASRLRSKLSEYYVEEGQNDAVRISIPKGHYVPVFAQAELPKTERKSQRKWQHSVGIATAMFVVFFIYTGFWKSSQESEVAKQIAHKSTPSSIAVLPFANRSDEKKDAYFVDGMHDDIITQLAKITSLHVISRTSMMGYRGTTKNMKTIGEELGVTTLLEGGIQRAGNQVRINVQLIDADTDKHLWAETYNKELTAANIFAIQSEIATAIADALLATLSPEEQERIAAVPTENLAAYEAYLLGKQRLAKRTTEALAEAVDYFQQAIDLDADFALAYVGLSDSYQIQSFTLQKDEVHALAEIAINKALTLDDKSGEAYTSLGLLRVLRNDYEGSEAAYKKALALNPNYASTYLWYATLLRQVGRINEASELLQKARAIDPLSIIVNSWIGHSYVWSGRFSEAKAQYEKVIEIDPTTTEGYSGIAYLYWFVYGRLDEAVPWLGKLVSLEPEDPGISALFGGLYQHLYDDKLAGCWINQGIKLGPESYWANLYMSYHYIFRGQYEQALPYAQQAQMVYSFDEYAIEILRDHEVRTGDYDKALSHYEESDPALLAEDKPTINNMNYDSAIYLAYVLQLRGDRERADMLLDRSLAFIRSGIPRLGLRGYDIADVQIYALKGEKQKALATLRQAIDDGWRAAWRYYLEHEPILESIRNEPEFQAMVYEIKADMAEQLARLKATEIEGDVCVNP